MWNDPRICFRLLLSATLVWAQVGSATVPAVAQPAGAADRAHEEAEALSWEEDITALTEVYEAIGDIRAAIDETGFSPAKLAERLGPDVTGLYEFVRNQISFHAYPGLLRFASGTLMEGAGNACDQSLLLSELLEAHGHRHRIMRGTLEEADAARLLVRLDTPSSAERREPVAPSGGDSEVWALQRLGLPHEEIEVLRSERDRWRSAFLEALSLGFDFSRGLIMTELKAAGLRPTGVDQRDAALEDARQHCWVQLRQDDLWLDLDPAANFLSAGEFLGAGTVTEVTHLDELGKRALAHSLRVAVSAEWAEGDHVKTEEVLVQEEPLLAAVNEITVFMAPDGQAALESLQEVADATKPDELLQAFKATKAFFPILAVNGVEVAGKVFHFRTDVTTEPTTTGNALGGLFESFSREIGQIFPTPLQRVWLTLELIAPDGTMSRAERTLAQRPKEGDEASREMALLRQMSTELQIAAAGGRVTNSYIMARELDHILDLRDAIFASQALLHGRSMGEDEQLVTLAEQSLPPPTESLKLLHTRKALLDFNLAVRGGNLAAYASRPQMAAWRSGPYLATGAWADGFDILFNRIRVVARSEDRFEPGAEFAVEQGLIDTLAEYLLLGGGEEVVNAVSVAARALGAGAGFVVLRPGDADALAALRLDDTTRAAIARDLAEDFAVIAPAASVTLAGKAAAGWWRVDPTTGETLGMGVLGGAASSEYTLLQRIWMGSVALGKAHGAKAAMCIIGMRVAIDTLTGKPASGRAWAVSSTLCILGISGWGTNAINRGADAAGRGWRAVKFANYLARQHPSVWSRSPATQRLLLRRVLEGSVALSIMGTAAAGAGVHIYDTYVSEWIGSDPINYRDVLYDEFIEPLPSLPLGLGEWFKRAAQPSHDCPHCGQAFREDGQ